jgi:hypothetical protein|nr:MAG TPA: hypothetical protein [Caudoviricetes sp.]
MLNDLKVILEKFDALEAQLLYNKAVEILKLITDEELERIFAEHTALFAKITNVGIIPEDLMKDRETIKEAIEVFIETLESRNLSNDEFEAMTLDDVKDYINSIIISKSPMLLRIINEIENDPRNKKY